ncbi:hypothetical protein KAI10_09030, partial [Candidatus Bathyarchaeota archaeon]|nr:hypothetical protein [Candidatus Bathyarchaeota archaeon]
MGFIDDQAAEKIGQILDGETSSDDAASSEVTPAAPEEVVAEVKVEASEVEPSVSEESSQPAGDVKQEAAE